MMRYTQADLPRLRAQLADLRREVTRREGELAGKKDIFLQNAEQRLKEAREDVAATVRIIAQLEGRGQRRS